MIHPRAEEEHETTAIVYNLEYTTQNGSLHRILSKSLYRDEGTTQLVKKAREKPTTTMGLRLTTTLPINLQIADEPNNVTYIILFI